MKRIEIDVAACRNPKEFGRVLQEAILALPGHGSSIESFVDSMVFGTMSELSPPYMRKIPRCGPSPSGCPMRSARPGWNAARAAGMTPRSC